VISLHISLQHSNQLQIVRIFNFDLIRRLSTLIRFGFHFAHHAFPPQLTDE
jgi:hypothetical protein